MTWKEIYKYLAGKGFDVYSLGQHKGICTEPYLVLRNNGASIVCSVSVQEYEILLYYPVNRYSEFEGYIDSVRQSMNGLYPHVKLVDDEQPHYMDADVQAYMTSLTYQEQKVSTVNRL